MRAGTTSAAALYEAQRSTPKIVTFCKELDDLLGGGVLGGHVTEFCEWPEGARPAA